MYFGKITFRYYTYDPKCTKYTNWNGTDCDPDYDKYCDSLTDSYMKLTGDRNIKVYYNGTACMVGDQNMVDQYRIYKVLSKMYLIKPEILNGTGIYRDLRHR